MPLPLPRFGFSVDVSLPVEIKPLLYYFDEYQTYDLIAWNGVTEALEGKIKHLNDLNLYNSAIFGISNDFNIEKGIHLLIDRYTRWDYPWCDTYSTQLYEFISLYSATFYYKNTALSFPSFWEEDSGDTSLGTIEKVRLTPPGYQVALTIDVLKVNFANSTIFAEFELPSLEILNIRIPKTAVQEHVVITFLRKEEKDNFDNTIEYSKHYVSIITDVSEERNLQLFLKDFVYCSAVISSSNDAVYEYVKSQIPYGCLYENFNKLLQLLCEIINKVHPLLFKLTEAFDYTVYRTKNVFADSHPYYGASIDVTGYTLTDRPVCCKSACLLYANNNRWSSNGFTTSTKDLGQVPTFYQKAESFDYLLLLPYVKDYFKDSNHKRHPVTKKLKLIEIQDTLVKFMLAQGEYYVEPYIVLGQIRNLSYNPDTDSIYVVNTVPPVLVDGVAVFATGDTGYSYYHGFKSGDIINSDSRYLSSAWLPTQSFSSNWYIDNLPGLMDYFTGFKTSIIVSYTTTKENNKLYFRDIIGVEATPDYRYPISVDYKAYKLRNIIEVSSKGDASIVESSVSNLYDFTRNHSGHTFVPIYNGFATVFDPMPDTTDKDSYTGTLKYHYFENHDSFNASELTVNTKPIIIYDVHEIVKLIDEKRHYKDE